MRGKQPDTPRCHTWAKDPHRAEQRRRYIARRLQRSAHRSCNLVRLLLMRTAGSPPSCLRVCQRLGQMGRTDGVTRKDKRDGRFGTNVNLQGLTRTQHKLTDFNNSPNRLSDISFNIAWTLAFEWLVWGTAEPRDKSTETLLYQQLINIIMT